jgi:Fur family iron response transcriptional regulator
MTRAEVIGLLRRHGITPTQQRVEIGRVLFARTQHVSAEDVLARVGAQGSPVSKATIYNTLGLFADKGLLREVVVDPTRRFYDTNLDPHHHIYYTDTGELQDITIDGLQLGSLPQLPDDAEVEGVDVIIRARRNTGR